MSCIASPPSRHGRELTRVKSAILNKYALNAQTFFARAERLCLNELMSDATMDASFPKLIEGVTPEDLRRVASRYWPRISRRTRWCVPRGEGSVPAGHRHAARAVARRWPALASTKTAGVGAVRREVLPNGLTLLVQEDHATPIVAVQAFARAASGSSPMASPASRTWQPSSFREARAPCPRTTSRSRPRRSA
jgi:hypothetical protein